MKKEFKKAVDTEKISGLTQPKSFMNNDEKNNKTWSDEVVTIRLGQTQRWNMPLPLGLFAYIKIKS